MFEMLVHIRLYLRAFSASILYYANQIKLKDSHMRYIARFKNFATLSGAVLAGCVFFVQHPLAGTIIGPPLPPYFSDAPIAVSAGFSATCAH